MSGPEKEDMKNVKTVKLMKGGGHALTWLPPAAAQRSVGDSDPTRPF